MDVFSRVNVDQYLRRYQLRTLEILKIFKSLSKKSVVFFKCILVVIQAQNGEKNPSFSRNKEGLLQEGQPNK